ncbi:ficolin-1 [Culex quinquefasciatus]|uniref:ficolin-1 n=1 Tax=Culex quinquefasciatus TaxID=7176 RepID=UPI0018E37B4E|nr:ficolin-1 [Culex quinquefasciatus]
MLFAIVGLLVVAGEILAGPNSTTGCNCGFGYELLEHRLEQMELKKQKEFEVQSDLLESMVKGLTALTRQTSQMLNRQINHQKRIIESCEDVTTSGRYRLQLPNQPTPITVICEMEPLDGGWLVIQRRSPGSINFNRSWTEYREGFGNAGQFGEFWLGLETIHQLTKAGDQELLVQLKNETGHYEYGRYKRFQVAGADQKYRLSPLVEFSGAIGEKLNISRDEAFSTYDKDNDQWTDGNCAQKYGGGWWFYKCGYTSLNGPYKKDNNTGRGIFWDGWTDAATYSRMLIRRR